ncbi:MAG: carbohydrate binding domain-containing protein [Flavobacteriales bacterium]
MKNRLLFCSLLLCYALSQAQNLVTNGGYESGFTGWTNLAGDGGSATYSLSTADKYEGTQAFKVVVSTKGSNAWSIQTMGPQWTATVGKVYVISFYAKALVSAPVTVVEQNTKYASQSFTLTSSWAKYEWQYTALETTPQHKFQFPQTGAFLIDALSITEYVAPVQSTTNVLTVTPGKTYQTLEGFGGAIAFYNNWVTTHQYKDEMYQLLYSDLGLDWLRIRNSYRNEVNFNTDDVEFVQKAKQYNPDARVLMCSWSPPTNLKSLGTLDSGTLVKENGKFVYGKFATYWKDALVAYAKIGVYPDLISIQNEPDWLTTQWETCKFEPAESASFPGYDKAFDSVYYAIKDLPNAPKMIGAEPLGIGYNNFSNFNTPIKNRSYLYGYAYHLYHGGTTSQPDSYNSVLADINTNFSNKPSFLTEYEINKEGWFKTGWLISNVLTEANSSTYFHWDLIWPTDGLITIENPWNKGSWKYSKGYAVTPLFYAMKHFSKELSGGWKRIDATNDNAIIRSSVFINPDGNKVVAVLINTGSKDVTSTLKLDNYTISGSAVYQSVEGNYYQSLGAVPVNGIVLPDSSITTIVYEVSAVTAVAEIENGVIFPNPFNEKLTVSFNGKFDYEITAVNGVVVEKGSGENLICVGETLSSGLYLLKVGNSSDFSFIKIIKQ